MTRAKICGITRHEDAELAVELGAWAIGLIRWDGSPRVCDAATAGAIVGDLRRRVACVGVFVNPSLEEIAREAEQIPYSHLQLHGDEGPAFCTEVARRTGCKIIKAARVASAGDIRDLERFHTDFHLLDARRSKTPLILSGGLGPDNLAEAIADVDPWAVDTASGTEREPGVKDPEKVRRFLDVAAGAHVA